jgi:hypothetical protein
VPKRPAELLSTYLLYEKQIITETYTTLNSQKSMWEFNYWVINVKYLKRLAIDVAQLCNRKSHKNQENKLRENYMRGIF